MKISPLQARKKKIVLSWKILFTGKVSYPFIVTEFSLINKVVWVMDSLVSITEKCAYKYCQNNQMIGIWIHITFIATLLHVALVIFSHVGSSNKSVSTPSSNSRFDNSPSPLIALTFSLSGERFLANLHKIRWYNVYINY